MVFVNGFNLGRYWRVGPQATLYLPAPVLKQGQNEVRVGMSWQEGCGLVSRWLSLH